MAMEDFHPEEYAILIVDDNEPSRYVTSRILQNEGYKVIEAENGKSALFHAKEDPDLIILDIQLPDINGFDICQTLKQDTDTAHIPILHLSATYMDSGSMVTGFNSGAEGYMTQPVEPPVLLATVRSTLRNKKIEQNLFLHKKILDNIINSAPVLIYLLDTEGRFILANKRVCEELHAPLDEIVGKTRYDLLPYDIADRHRINDMQVIKTEHVQEYVERNIQPDGMHIFKSIKFPVLDTNGNIFAIGGISQDITENIYSEEIIREQTIMLNLAPVFITNKEGRIIYWNAGSQKIFGWPKEDAIGKFCFELLLKSHGSSYQDIREKIIKEGVHIHDFTYQRSDGNEIVVTSILTPYYDSFGILKAIIHTNTDITASIELKKIRIEALSKCESLMSHLMIMNDEIRNPLSIMSSAIDLESERKDIIILEQIQAIDSIIDKVDKGYLESAKIHNFLKKYEQFP